MPRKLQTSKAYRNARTEKCMRYLREAEYNMPRARELARVRERFMPNTSAWLTALGRLLGAEDEKR